GSLIAGPLATTRPMTAPAYRMSSTSPGAGVRPSATDPPSTQDLAIGAPAASTTAICKRSDAGGEAVRIRWTRAGSSAAVGSVMADRDVVSDRGDRGRAIGMGDEQPVEPGSLEHASHGGLGAAELDLRL